MPQTTIFETPVSNIGYNSVGGEMASVNDRSSQDHSQTLVPVSVSNNVRIATSRKLSQVLQPESDFSAVSSLMDEIEGSANQAHTTNECGAPAEHCRLNMWSSVHLPIWSSTFDPPLKFNSRKKTRMDYTSESTLSESPMKSTLSDETEECIPFRQVQPRKIGNLPDLDYSDQATSKCMDCETSETLNVCGYQYKYGRVFPDNRPLGTLTFDPSLHCNPPKEVQKMKMDYTGNRSLKCSPKLMKTEDTRMCDSSKTGCSVALEPERVNMGFLDTKRNQNSANRPKISKEITEMPSTLLHSESREGNQTFDVVMMPEQKLLPQVVKKCLHCESTETSDWRKGPMGHGTLCNACGIRYSNNKLFPAYRPLNSPTYDPILHSHISKKAQKMGMGNIRKKGLKGPNCTSKPKVLEEIEFCKIAEMSKNIASEPERVDGVSLGKKNECSLNHLSRAKKFHETTKKVNSLVQPKSRKRNQSIDTKMVLKQTAPLKVVKKCQHCESTQTLHWREGPMGRIMLCNTCVTLYNFGRQVPYNSPLESLTCDPSLSSCLPGEVQEPIVGNRCQKDPNCLPKPKKAEQMTMASNSEMDQNHPHRAKKYKDLKGRASDMLVLGSGEKNQNSDCNLIRKCELPPEKVKKCLHCESTETALWRTGPMGRKTLCNACGIQFRHGRLYPEYRPRDSPTYDPTLHSHLPKGVLEIRMRNAEQCAAFGNQVEPV